MDIYAGENQHASQYIAFNKVREFSNGKKIITLSECGSVPDPALMKEYGDTWSWFMPWNADFTRADKYNGATWWNKYFGYDYVITRDKMPSLK
jgi:mannan endo-1,4-beta-mannosidase